MDPADSPAPSAAPASSKRGGAAWKRAGVALLSTLLGLGLLEVGHRMVLRFQGQPYDRAALEDALRRSVDTTAAFVPEKDSDDAADSNSAGVLHPFYASEHHPDTGGVLKHFREGRDASEFTVLITGGSVAGAFARDGAPVLRARLEADPRLGGQRVRILNFAHAAYKQPQQVDRLAYLFAYGYRPQLVVNIDGFNEVAVGMQNGVRGSHPLYPAPNVWESLLRDRRGLEGSALDALVELSSVKQSQARFADRVLRWNLATSSLVGRFVEHHMNELARQRGAAQVRYLDERKSRDKSEASRRQMFGPDYSSDPGEILRMCVNSWFESALNMQALCKQRDIEYVECLQPALFDHGSKPKSQEEAKLSPGAPGWQEAAERGLPLLRARGAELAQRGIDFVDGSYAFSQSKQTLYYDSCHFVAAGSALLAEPIAAAALATLAEEGD